MSYQQIDIGNTQWAILYITLIGKGAYYSPYSFMSWFDNQHGMLAVLIVRYLVDFNGLHSKGNG